MFSTNTSKEKIILLTNHKPSEKNGTPTKKRWTKCRRHCSNMTLWSNIKRCHFARSLPIQAAINQSGPNCWEYRILRPLSTGYPWIAKSWSKSPLYEPYHFWINAQWPKDIPQSETNYLERCYKGTLFDCCSHKRHLFETCDEVEELEAVASL